MFWLSVVERKITITQWFYFSLCKLKITCWYNLDRSTAIGFDQFAVKLVAKGVILLKVQLGYGMLLTEFFLQGQS